MIQLGLLGGSGRMGQEVQRLLADEFKDQFNLVAIPSRKDPLDGLLECDVLIDFSLPEVSTRLVTLALKQPSGKKLPCFAIGSTGWSAEQLSSLRELAKRTPVLLASNFSIGVALLHRALAQVAPLLLAEGYHPVLIERHHIHKKDSPSGTAIALQRTISPEGPGNVPIYAIRAGEVIGDHDVQFIGKADQLVFSHHAQNRSIFARGALRSALRLCELRGKNPSKDSILSMDMLFS